MRASSNVYRAVQQFLFESTLEFLISLFPCWMDLELSVFHLGWVASKRNCWTATQWRKHARAQSEQQCKTHFEDYSHVFGEYPVLSTFFNPCLTILRFLSLMSYWFFVPVPHLFIFLLYPYWNSQRFLVGSFLGNQNHAKINVVRLHHYLELSSLAQKL